MSASSPVLRLRGLTKRFGALVANDSISLDLDRGEVLALLGENGAGKSTLVSILFGHYVADEGSIEVDGRPLPPGQPKAALAAGIGMVHQHFTLADNLSVLDNVMLGTESLWQPFSRRGEWRARLQDAAQRFGLHVDPDARIAELSVGERQRVEILKALVRGARILILDEPTAVLTPQESESLFATLAQMVAGGLSIIFISHKLDEVLRVSDRVAVLRAGKLIAVLPAAGASKSDLAEAMVGRSVAPAVKTRREAGAVVCELPGTTLAIRAGEVFAVAGVAGNGQQALADALCGELAPPGGALRLDGRALPASPRRFVAAGVARIPEDRHAVGVVGDLPIWENAVLERYASAGFARAGVVRRGAARAFAQQVVERFDVRGGGLETTTRSLSGGNMQKLILGRALLGSGSTPRLVVANQPTWGLDIGAVAYVHQQLLDACAAGAALLLISEDLDEIFALADRIAVLHHGVLGAPRPAADWTLAEIGLAMSGAQTEARHAA
ncbi:sugar ABC transporter ATP-binding protein [Rubrivivax gelatinosus]|uniref:Sugar ABC transporter ATP-binding protein n=1 Tax=Rubrivivax gelatinosus TaxID=28068 RepID=A0ABS1E1G9_RUBGE|nr:ABC transporter ATP-binding protein [Rubrivivax gelatinosus]MBK1613389.1 sugar ABC transporter ATP-binding protein [Rubrivivax gelatinosus]MBK1715295.1 sugar ABC transporter ATP-binding protein [Rubrivivax gelatinosus]